MNVRKFSPSRIQQALGFAALSLATSVASASAMSSSDPFYDFATTVQGWASGPLGIGLATTMLIMGAGIGVAKNSPMPALSGVAGAAFLHWGPTIISSVLGAVV
jgi:conjugal transfer pilus assembly protein TraA